MEGISTSIDCWKTRLLRGRRGFAASLCTRYFGSVPFGWGYLRGRPRFLGVAFGFGRTVMVASSTSAIEESELTDDKEDSGVESALERALLNEEPRSPE